VIFFWGGIYVYEAHALLLQAQRILPLTLTRSSFPTSLSSQSVTCVSSRAIYDFNREECVSSPASLHFNDNGSRWIIAIVICRLAASDSRRVLKIFQLDGTYADSAIDDESKGSVWETTVVTTCCAVETCGYDCSLSGLVTQQAKESAECVLYLCIRIVGPTSSQIAFSHHSGCPGYRTRRSADGHVQGLPP